jgi:transcription termination factor Rho
MKLNDLKALATSMGIKGTSRLRKDDLAAAIRGAGGGSAPKAAAPASAASSSAPAKRSARPAVAADSSAPERESVSAPAEKAANPAADTQPSSHHRENASAPDHADGSIERPRQRRNRRAGRPTGEATHQPHADADASAHKDTADPDKQAKLDALADAVAAPRTSRNEGNQRDNQREAQGNRRNQNTRNAGQQNAQGRNAQDGNAQGNQQGQDDDGNRRRNRRDRNRDRNKNRRSSRGPDVVGGDEEVREDDVLIPIAGILDVLDNYAFVRTSGYLPGPNDAYVTLNQVRRNGLRRGDMIQGAIRQPREGEGQFQGNNQGNRPKFSALVRIDLVNGMTVEEASKRKKFGDLTPLYPQERLRLEIPGSTKLSPRLIDIISPIGKGQRGLLISPPKAGKTILMQQIANSITTNNPEVHLMVVLVDERPEEVTDFQRSVDGEVIASTFDRHASDHTIVAELAIERAKRLVELDHDVVILMDGITRLGRAYNLAAPASGRILSGGVDAGALYPPKKFFGAARNIENGGSLTIIATGLVETGSKMDEVIFEEFKGTGNWELRLSRQLSEKRIFPAIDVNASGTRREEILMSREELGIIFKLRRILGSLETQQATELLINKLKDTKTNVEFLLGVRNTTPGDLDPGAGDTI